MNCRDFERGLESPGLSERRALEVHAAQCQACAELLELASLPVLESADLVTGVLGRTSGSACRQAEESLVDFADRRLPAGAARELVAEHVGHCRACSALVHELERLAYDLPRLAVIEPEISLVDAVLRRTLPAPVRLRRWWSETWPLWMRRPRFATEFAYALTLVLVILFGTPFSPLEAMPERALELARTEPVGRFEALESATREEIGSRLAVAVDSGSRQARSAVDKSRKGLGTILDEVASWFVTAEDDTPAETNETKEETS